MSCSAKKNTRVVSVLIFFVTGFNLILAQMWKGIDPCLDPISCFVQDSMFNISVANPENCAQYFLCRNTTLYLTQCPSGYQFDINTQRCVTKNWHCSSCSSSQMSYKDHIFKDSTGTSTTRSDDNGSDHRTSPTTFFSTFVPRNLTTTLSKYNDNLSPASFPMKSTFSVATVTTYKTTMSSSSASFTKRDDVVSSSLKPLGSTKVSIRESEKTVGYSNSTSVSNRKTDSDQTQKSVTLTSAKNITPSSSPSTLSTSMSPSTSSMSPSTPSMSTSTPSMSPSTPSMSPSTPSMSPSTPSMSPSTPSMSPSTPSMSPSTSSMSPSTPSMFPSTPSMSPSTPSMSPSTPSMSPSTPSMSPSTPSMSPSTPSMSPSTPSMSPSTPSTSPSTSSMSPSTPSMSPSTSSMSPSTPSMSPSTPSMSPSTPSMSPSTSSMSPSTPSMSPSTPSMSPSSPSMSPSTPSMSPSTPSMSPSTPSMSPSTSSMFPSTLSTSMFPSTSSMSPSTLSMSPSTPSMSPSTPSMSPSTPSMSPSTSSMSPSTPSMSPSTPSMSPSSPSMSPSTPSMSPSTPSMSPSTPSMSPSTPSMSPSTPSMSPSTPSTSMSPSTPSMSPSTPSMSSSMPSTIAPIMPTNSTQEFSTSSQTSSTIAPIMPTNSTQELSTSIQTTSTIAPIVPTNSTQEFSPSSQTSSTIAPIMPTNSTQEFSFSSQTSSTIAPIVPTISTSVDPTSGRTSSFNFTSLESTNTPNNITEDIFSSTTFNVSTHSIIEISSSEITTQVPNIPTNSTISSFRLTTSTIMPSVPTMSTSEFSSSDTATSTTLKTNMPANGTFEISTESTSDMPNNITGELSSPQIITSPSVTLNFSTNATVELSSPGMTSSAATPIIFPRNMTDELSSEGTKSSDATASASTDSTIISSSWKPTQAATSLDMQGSTAHSTPQKTTPITLSQSTSSSSILGNFSSDAFSFKTTNTEQSSSTKDKSTPAQVISSVTPTSVSAVSRILSIGSTSMGSTVSTSIFSAQNPVTDLTQSPGVGTTFGVINSCRSPTSCIINDLMGDPDDCFRYYECIAVPSSDNRWINKVCPGNQQFDIRSKTCSSSTSIECQPRCPTNTSHSVWMNPKQAIQGGLLQFVCSFWVQSSFNQIQVEKFEWQLNGIQLTPSGNRISVSQTAAGANGTMTSTLTFFPASITDSGVIRSVVKYGSKFTSTLVTTPFVVLPLPSVQILPLSLTIYPNTNISISCQADVGKSNFLTGSVDANVSVVTFDWFRNGVLITADDFESNGMSSILKASPAASVVYSCRARNSVGVGGNESLTVTVIPEYLPSCKAEQKDGLFWTMTSVNDTAVMPCEKPLMGFVERQCSKQPTTGAAIWLEPNTIHCIHETLSDIRVQIDRINEGFGANNISIILGVITALEDFSSSGPLGLGDLNTTIVLVGEIASICSSLPDTILLTSDEVEPAIQTINNLLSSINRPTWMDMKMSDPSAAARLMKAVDIFASQWARSLKPDQQDTLITDNIVVEVACDYAHSVGSISYPQQTSTMEDSFWMMSSEDKIEVSNATLQPDHGTDSVLYISSSYYNNIHDFLPVNTSQHLNSRVLSLSIDGMPSTDSLTPGVRILLQNISGNWSDANFTRSCAFWDFTYNRWSSNGCKVISEDPTSTSCECNHLTNFAILMSPTVASKEDEMILSIISIIGCIISLVSLVLTLIMYAMRWKIIKSHHAVVVINLCIALIIANVVFLAGVDKVNPPEVCTTVAVLLHYFFLAAFFIMLAEGIELLLYIVFVFHVRRRRETALLILTAWVIPLIIVGVSLAITQTRGYGGSRSCWLSIENGLLWAFVGPALTVIGINLLIMLIVLIRIARANRPIEKRGFKPRMKATVWNILVITPVLGLTWVFGVLAVSQSLIAFQYVFAVANSLQGFFIFVFHGLCNRRRQKKSRYSVKLPSNRSRSSQGGRIRAKSSQRQNRLTTSDIVVMMSPPDSSDSQTILPDYDRRSDAITRIRDGEKVSVCSSSSSSSSSGVSQTDSDYHSNNTITTDVLSNNSHNSNQSNVVQRKVDSAAHTTFF